MASNLASELSGTQVVELIACLGRAGLKPEKAKELMGDHEKMAEFVKNGLKKDPYRGIPAVRAYQRYAAAREGRAFTAHVEYRRLSEAEVRKIFDQVPDEYQHIDFKLIDACKDISREPRDLDFEIVHFNRFMSTDEAIAELHKLGLRPAIHEEALAVAPKLKELPGSFPIAALGSVCKVPFYLYSSYLYRDKHDDWCLRDGSIDSGWVDTVRFLGVPF